MYNDGICSDTIWDIERKKLIVARNVIFNENEFWYKGETENEGIETENDDSENEKSTMSRTVNKRSAKLPKKFSDYVLLMVFDAYSFIENVPTRFLGS